MLAIQKKPLSAVNSMVRMPKGVSYTSTRLAVLLTRGHRHIAVGLFQAPELGVGNGCISAALVGLAAGGQFRFAVVGNRATDSPRVPSASNS